MFDGTKDIIVKAKHFVGSLMSRSEWWGMLSSGIFKRLLEDVYTDAYNKLLATKFGQKLKEAGVFEKYSAELLLNALAATADQIIPEKGFFLKAFKETLVDSAAEISKRIINGMKEEGVQIEYDSSTEEFNRELSSIFGKVNVDDLPKILSWIYSIKDPVRSKVLKQLSRLSPQELKSLSALSPEDLEKYADILQSEFFNPESWREALGKLTNKAKKEIAGGLSSVNQNLSELVNWLDKKKRGEK